MGWFVESHVFAAMMRRPSRYQDTLFAFHFAA